MAEMSTVCRLVAVLLVTCYSVHAKEINWWFSLVDDLHCSLDLLLVSVECVHHHDGCNNWVL